MNGGQILASGVAAQFVSLLIGCLCLNCQIIGLEMSLDEYVEDQKAYLDGFKAYWEEIILRKPFRREGREMSLDEYVEEQKAYLDGFKAYWESCVREDEGLSLLEMELGDWLEHFLAWEGGQPTTISRASA